MFGRFVPNLRSMAIAFDDVDLDRDRALVQRFQAGDGLAFDDLYRRYFPRLVRFCRRRTDDDAEAEELAQEAFAKAWRALPNLSGDQRFYPWLTVIAGRLCVDAGRRRTRAASADRPVPTVLADEVDGPEAVVVRLVQRQLLHDALDRLTPRHREVLELREQRGWSYAEIADHYAVSVGTVEALLWRARRALQREFEALDGRDAGIFVSLPVLGRLLRRVQEAGARASRWAGMELAPAAAPFMAGATVAASVLLGTVGLGAPDAARPAVRPTEVLAVRGTPVAELTPIDAEGRPRIEPAVAAPAPDPTPIVGEPAKTSEPLTVGSAAEARRRSEQEPVAGDAGGLVVGADPREVAGDALVKVNGYVQQLDEEGS